VANRTMQAKSLKLQRQLRSLPRRIEEVQGNFDSPDHIKNKFSAAIPKRLLAEGVVAPRQPTRELMQQYQHHAKSLSRDDKPGKFTGIPPARKAALDLIERLQALYEASLSFTILDTRVHRARVFYPPQRTTYVLVYENYKQGTIQHSLPHVCKKELVDRFRCKSLTWVEYAH
jgi:hypothetical protein